MMGIVVGKSLGASSGVFRGASEKSKRRTGFCEERDSEQSGKCSPVGLAGDSGTYLDPEDNPVNCVGFIMLRRKPTRLELKLDDIEEFESIRKDLE
eukprot:bmy_05199T0